MKKFSAVIIILSLFGCKSGKTYYAYEDAVAQTYAVMVVSKNHGSVQYQASSNRYPDKYIYINGRNSPLYVSEVEIDVFSDITIINRIDKLEDCLSLDGGMVVSYTTKGDSIFYSFSREVECLDRFKVEWFPPYMTKVKKIDYNKFPENLRKAIIAINKNKPFRKVEKAIQAINKH